MPFNRSTPKQILDRLYTEIDSAIVGASSRLRYSVESVIAKMIAMASHEMLGYISWVAKQILPDTADLDYLIRHGSLYGITQKAANAATGPVTFVGTNGATVPAGSILRRGDDAEFTLDADATIASGTATGTVTAVLPGADGISMSGVKLTLTSPVAGVQSQATVAAAGIDHGTDIEGVEDLRDRILARRRNPPHGGAAFDYVEWAREVAGVTRAWPYPSQYGSGTVAVIFVMDGKSDTIIPTSGEVLAVQTHLDIKRPVTAEVTVVAPTAVPVNFEIHIRPNTVEIQQAIIAELADFFKREAIPGGTLYMSRMNEVISSALGEFDHICITPNDNVEMTFGQLPVLGTFTWASLG